MDRKIINIMIIIIVLFFSIGFPILAKEYETKPFIVQCQTEDGLNGYYTRYPNIQIQHKDDKAVTKYKLLSGIGKIYEGEISQSEDSLEINRDMLEEGKNQLEVWMEDEEGSIIDGQYYSKEITIDTVCPSIQMTAPYGFSQWYKDSAPISVSTSDGKEGSQIMKIECMVEKEKIQETKDSSTIFAVTRPSVYGSPVKVRANVYDNAGNVSSVEKEIFIDKSAPNVLIENSENYTITSMPQNITYSIQEENILQEFGAATKCKSPKNEEVNVINGEWESLDGINRMTQTLSEDGVYKMEIYAVDAAGHKSVAASQIIIDKTNPIISYVEDLEGMYVKEFQWEYPIEEVIQDFTSYTYEILLDEEVYISGSRIMKEGKHILKVKAVDAAGNKAQAAAEFIVDRTKPEILFMDIGEGQSYEEEKTFRIKTKDVFDELISVEINGVENINSKGNVYQVKDKGAYVVKVKAKDRAGNIGEKELFFEIIPKTASLHTVFDNIKTKLKRKNEPDKKQQENKSKTRWPIYVIVSTTAVIALAIKNQDK